MKNLELQVSLDRDQVVDAIREYLASRGLKYTSAEFEISEKTDLSGLKTYSFKKIVANVEIIKGTTQ